MGSGITDKIAILDMGCSVFGECWDAEPAALPVDLPAGLMVEAFSEALSDVGIEKEVFRICMSAGSP